MKHHKWTKQDNSEVLYCYYSSCPNERGYRARLYSLWRERNPDGAPFSEQRIADQALSLLRRGEFTAVELEELRRRVEGANTRFEDSSGTSPPQVQFVDSPDGVSFANDYTISSYNLDGACTFQDLTARQKELQFKIQAELSLAQERVRLPKLHYCNSLKQITMDANIAVASIHTNCLEETLRLVYATALVVNREMGYSVMQSRSVTASQAVPPWRRRITSKIARLRSDLSQLDK